MAESEIKAFFDTDILLYLLSSDEAKADKAEQVIAGGGTISVQVLNEFASVAIRKPGLSWGEIREISTWLRAICTVESITVATHDRGLEFAERYGLSIYDAMIIASAYAGGCTVVYSEEMQHGQIFDERLTIHNPFETLSERD
ncbi:MAG: PIN domain-containing protein [Gammaproteobacteria bacterium]